MSAENRTPPQYSRLVVEQAILEEAVELHPRRLTPAELSLRIIADPDDSREVETAIRAICELSHCGLLRYGEDGGVIEPTPVAIRACALLS